MKDAKHMRRIPYFHRLVDFFFLFCFFLEKELYAYKYYKLIFPLLYNEFTLSHIQGLYD